MNRELKEYLDNYILPQYDTYDKGHNRNHILQVAAAAMELAAGYDVDEEMLYTAAMFHDLGLIEGRDTHHITSARMMREDAFIAVYFTEDQIELISDAIEDHRASAKTAPRSVYGDILSSADRVIDVDTVIMRSYFHNEKHYPSCTIEDNIELIYKHITNKYGEGGYLTIPILTQQNKEGLERLRSLLVDEAEFKSYCMSRIKINI